MLNHPSSSRASHLAAGGASYSSSRQAHPALIILLPAARLTQKITSSILGERKLSEVPLPAWHA